MVHSTCLVRGPVGVLMRDMLNSGSDNQPAEEVYLFFLSNNIYWDIKSENTEEVGSDVMHVCLVYAKNAITVVMLHPQSNNR